MDVIPLASTHWHVHVGALEATATSRPSFSPSLANHFSVLLRSILARTIFPRGQLCIGFRGSHLAPVLPHLFEK